MTPYSKIDDLFLSDINDSDFFLYTEIDRQKILDRLRDKAITRFKQCKNDLSDRVPTTYEVVGNEENPEEELEENNEEENVGNEDAEQEIVMTIGYFNADLTDEEQLIIATIMRKYWLNDKIYNLNLLKQKMSTKDWKFTSSAEHLLRLLNLKQELDKEISRMIINYCNYAYKLGD